jgi:hypothetical protein
MRSRMQSNSMIKIPALLLLCCVTLSASPAYGQKESKKHDPPLTEKQLQELHIKAKVKPPSGVSFYIAPIVETPGRFSMSFTDADGRTLSGVYVRSQIDILEAILAEAKKFAQTDESVGLKKPTITRLSDSKEPGLFVDVAKMGVQSQFFITVKYMDEFITVDAGTIKRGDEKSKALLYDILTRVQEVKNSQVPQ